MTSPIRRSRARARRGRNLAAVAGIVVAGAALFVVLAVRLASSPELNVGDDEFDAGPVRNRAREIARDNEPLLFPDLRNQGLDIYVNHLDREPTEGWVAFAARAPGAPRRCPLEWSPRRGHFVDRCNGRTFPPDGTGLRQFTTRVEDGRLIIDLREAPTTTTSSSTTSTTSPS